MDTAQRQIERFFNFGKPKAVLVSHQQVKEMKGAQISVWTHSFKV